MQLNGANGQEIMRNYLYEAPEAAKARYSGGYWDKYHLGAVRPGSAGSVASKQHYLNWGCVGSRALTDANLSMRRLDARYELDRPRKCVLLLLTAPPVLGRLP